eukprot:scaffold70237_cov57-Phaeocystis_antarctica.AAC.2
MRRHHSLQGLCPAAAHVCAPGEPGFHGRSRVQRRNPIKVRGRLFELRCRARLRLPNITIQPAQHHSPHLVGCHIVRQRPHNPRRQRLELLVFPPLRLGHLDALRVPQHVEGICRCPCPALRAHQIALLGLEVPLCGLHVVPRVHEHATEAGVRAGLVGPQGDGLTICPGCSAPVVLGTVLHALSHQLRVRIARLRGEAGLPLRSLASPLLQHPAIILQVPLRLHLLVIHRVQLPRARVPRALDAAPVRRCFSRSSSMSDGSLAQPKQARLSAKGKGAALSSAAGGATAAASAASLSAFSAASATRTSLGAAPRFGSCSRSLASSGLKPRSGSASHSPRTASRRASDVQGSHMRRCPRAPPPEGAAAVPSPQAVCRCGRARQ